MARGLSAPLRAAGAGVRPLVAVSQRVDAVPARQEVRDGLDQALAAWLVAAGLLPVPVPNGLHALHRLAAWLEAVAPGAVVLSGGDDLGQAPDRDSTEAVLLHYAQARRLPVLGLCRGLQVMAVQAGADLKPVSNHVGARHRIHGDSPDLVGDVNSYHRFGLHACPPGYRIAARSEDGEIEALAHLDLPWEGWMWHPERERPFQARHLGRASALLTGRLHEQGRPFGAGASR